MKTPIKSFLMRWYVIVTIVIIISAVVLRIHAGIMPVAASIPMPVMPSPNARDTFTAAEALEQDGNSVDYAIGKPSTAPIPPGEDASNPTSQWHVFSWSDKASYIAENQPALAKLREGLNQQYMNPPMRSFDTLFPYFAKDRAMARLLSLDTEVKAHNGDWKHAASASLDAIQLGSKIPKGSPMIGLLVGIASEEVGRKRLSETSVIDHLSAADAKADALRMADINAEEIPYSDVLQEEKWGGQSSLLDMFSKPNWRHGFFQNFTGVDSSSESASPTEPIREAFIVATISPRHSYELYSEYMEQMIANAKQPWPIQRNTPAPKIPTSDPICSVMLPIFSQANFKAYANIALDRLLEAQLALRAYREDHGAYPESLSQLVPAYIPSVPIDPFSNNQPVIYRLNGGGYLLYSVGQDGVDNGGTPIDNQAYYTTNHISFGSTPVSSEQIHSAMRDVNATGDIVSGVND